MKKEIKEQIKAKVEAGVIGKDVEAMFEFGIGLIEYSIEERGKMISGLDNCEKELASVIESGQEYIKSTSLTKKVMSKDDVVCEFNKEIDAYQRHIKHHSTEILHAIKVFEEKKAENPEAADIIDQIISGYDWIVKEITGEAEISTAANCKVEAVIEDVEVNDEPEYNEIDAYIGIDKDSDDDDELIDESLQDLTTITPTANALLENKVAQLKKSIACDEQELETLKSELDRIMKNIARLEARLNTKQKQLESLKSTVAVEATALTDKNTTTSIAKKYVDIQLKYSA